MAITSQFSTRGTLNVQGDTQSNPIEISRDAAGNVLVNGGAVATAGGVPTVVNTKLVQMGGGDGNDTMSMNESNGALPKVSFSGGNGNDTMTGGSGDDLLLGDAGNDSLFGKGGVDLMHGGDGNDTLTGGTGNDFMFGDNGDDRLIWNPGEGSDQFDGGDGVDTAEVNGGNGAEVFTLTANGSGVRFDRVSPAPFSIDAVAMEKFVINMNGGDDQFSATGNLAALVGVTVDGGTGNDTISGSNGADTLIGGDGNDFIDGQQGNDIAFLGAGEDVFQWDPGDGSDTVEGQDGNDTMLFNGSAGNEIFALSANGARALFTRNLGNIVMDLDDVEKVELNALGGADSFAINDMHGTDVTTVLVDLAGTIGGTAGDSQIDTVDTRGTSASDAITMSRLAGQADVVVINGLAAKVQIEHFEGGDVLQISGLGGNDTIALDEAIGALPAVQLDGGAGNDVLTGGSGSDTLRGGADNDTLLAKGGNDLLFGGDGNDTLTGGDGDDQMFGEGGDDRLIWNPGDDTDLFEGGDGVDTAEVNGGNGSEVFTLTANGTRVRFDRVNPAPFSIDIGTTEKIVVNMNGGDDQFSATGNLAALIGVTVDGGTGNDSISGSNGADTLIGGDGNDFIDGQQGNDIAFLGAGEDVFQWDPGDGSDVVEGQAGNDSMLFNGSAGNEIFALSANGDRALFTRNLGNIVMDLDDVEKVELNMLGGVDALTVNDMTGTDVNAVLVNLSGTIGGTAGDAAADTVTINGSIGDNAIDVFGAGSSISVLGLAAKVDLTGTEGANDALVINGLGGNDNIIATTLPAGVIKLTLDGGAGNDRLLGSQGADTLIGGDGNDFVFGDNGNDTAFLGAGDDVFEWDPGDGNDTIEGQAGTDAMLFVGANIAETINITANGGRSLFLRDVANVTMDLDDVERIEFRALGGADTIAIGDMSGTDVTRIDLDLRAAAGGADGAVDNVTVNASNAADSFTVSGNSSNVAVSGLSSVVNLQLPDATDRLTLNGQGGDDVINAQALQAGVLQLTMNGGLGNDLFIGSAGNDLFNGGDGNDTALMGGGNDTFVWNPGDDNDIVEGQAGSDTLLFNGANIAERINITANGGRALFTRDVANVVMDLNDTETIEFKALGGADSITVNDLSGTDVTDVRIDLAASGGGGDGAADTVTVNATSADDVVVVTGDAGTVTVLGLSARVTIIGFEPGVDRLIINLLAGDDTLEASSLAANSILLTGNGGDGSDILIGGEGNDTLTGGAGDDVLLGGPGTDTLDGGTGDNVVIQLVGAHADPHLIL